MSSLVWALTVVMAFLFGCFSVFGGRTHPLNPTVERVFVGRRTGRECLSPQLTGLDWTVKEKKRAGGKIMCGVDGSATVAPDGQMKHVYLQGSHLDSVSIIEDPDDKLPKR